MDACPLKCLASALLALTDEQMTGVHDPSIRWVGFDPAMGTVRSLVESGNLAVVSDRAIRLGLAPWTGLLENNPRFNLQAVQVQQREVMPSFARAAADGRSSAGE